MTRAIEKAETRWLLSPGAVGFAFLTKMLQAFLVVPGFALVYLLAGAARSFWRRVRQLALRRASRWSSRPAGGSRSSTLWPREPRPYIGGSQDNTILNLIFGYNGFGRLTGNETGSVGGGGGAGTAPACGAPPA